MMKALVLCEFSPLPARRGGANLRSEKLAYVNEDIAPPQRRQAAGCVSATDNASVLHPYHKCCPGIAFRARRFRTRIVTDLRLIGRAVCAERP
jgi:hypothetical protein